MERIPIMLNVWKHKLAQRIENEKILRAKKTLSMLKNGKIPIEFRDEEKNKDFKFLPDINIIWEFLMGIGFSGNEFLQSGLRSAWGEVTVSTKRIHDLF